MKYKMPLLKYANQCVPEIDWSNTLVIGCQHLLESTFLYFQKLIDNGLPAEQLYLLGKPYSSCDDIIDEFNKLGVYIHPNSQAYNSHQSFDLQNANNISKFFQYVTSKEDLTSYHKVMIIDEGGQLLSYVHQHIHQVTNIVGIEQTTTQITDIDNITAKFPIVSIARSQTKKVLEAPFIATALIDNLQEQISQLSSSAKSVVIIGNDYLSQQLYQQLNYQYDSYLIETNDLTTQDQEQYYPLINNADIIISTAHSIFSEKDYKQLKDGVILASGGDSDTTFDAVQLRRQQTANNDPHRLIQAKGANGDIFLINSGFAVNFDGSWQKIPLHHIQLTISLLYCAICKAHQQPPAAGIGAIDEQLQETLIAEFQRMLTC